MNCYFLPLSNCTPNYDGTHTITLPRDYHVAVRERHIDTAEAFKYFARPKQAVRKKLFDMMQEYNMPSTTTTITTTTPPSSCTTVHVRRGDTAFPKPPFRRYAALSEYIKAGNIAKGDTILLLTDDQSTIEEAQQLHSNDYHWLYLNRTRFKGPEGGYNGHIPSGDPPTELMFILLELKLATICNKFVYGSSGFANKIKGEFLLKTMGNSSSLPQDIVYLHTEMNKDTAKAQGGAQERANKFWTEFYDDKNHHGQGNRASVKQ